MELGPVFVIELINGKYVVKRLLRGELRSVRLATFNDLEDAESYVESLIARELAAQVVKVLDEVFGDG